MKIEISGAHPESVVSIPKVANGAGSVTDLRLKIDKKFAYKGQKHSVLSAKCVGGKTRIGVTTKFYDGRQLHSGLLRSTAKN